MDLDVEDSGAGADVQVPNLVVMMVIIILKTSIILIILVDMVVIIYIIVVQVAVIRETRRLLPEFHISYTIPASVTAIEPWHSVIKVLDGVVWHGLVWYFRVQS